MLRARLGQVRAGAVIAFVVLAGSMVLLANPADSLASYEGDTLSTEDSTGYLSWDGTVTLVEDDGVDTAGVTSAHGGYVATSTKCGVCHSVHRASSDLEGDVTGGVGEYWQLTPGGEACIACHAPGGSNPTNRLIEWPAIYSDGGPHVSHDCIGACHSSIHGGSSSRYEAMNAYMLSGHNDVAIAASFAAGNEYTEDDSLANDAVGRERGIITEEVFRTYSIPDGNQGESTRRSLRASATGFACSAVGCHSSSQLVVNARGFADARASDPEDPYMLDVFYTGHYTNTTYGCAPCHQNDIGDVGKEGACGRCHDAIGKATLTTAFPHANRNITLLETTDGVTWTEIEAGPDGRNLWMYYGDATKRDSEGNPSPTGTVDPSRTLLRDATALADLTGHADRGNIVDGVCLKCHAYKYGEYHVGTERYAEFYRVDGTPTGNVLDFSKF